MSSLQQSTGLKICFWGGGTLPGSNPAFTPWKPHDWVNSPLSASLAFSICKMGRTVVPASGQKSAAIQLKILAPSLAHGKLLMSPFPVLFL